MRPRTCAFAASALLVAVMTTLGACSDVNTALENTKLADLQASPLIKNYPVGTTQPRTFLRSRASPTTDALVATISTTTLGKGPTALLAAVHAARAAGAAIERVTCLREGGIDVEGGLPVPSTWHAARTWRTGLAIFFTASQSQPIGQVHAPFLEVALTMDVGLDVPIRPYVRPTTIENVACPAATAAAVAAA